MILSNGEIKAARLEGAAEMSSQGKKEIEEVEYRDMHFSLPISRWPQKHLLK